MRRWRLNVCQCLHPKCGLPRDDAIRSMERIATPHHGTPCAPARRRKPADEGTARLSTFACPGAGRSASRCGFQGPAELAALLPMMQDRHWRIAPLFPARNARVAIQDECGEILGVRISVMLIGERPGLTVPDSLAVYFTWAPRKGRHDVDRNCISNIHDHGLPPKKAASRLVHLMDAAFTRRLSGVALKDDP